MCLATQLSKPTYYPTVSKFLSTIWNTHYLGLGEFGKIKASMGDSVGPWGIEQRISHTGSITWNGDWELSWNGMGIVKLLHCNSTQIILGDLRNSSQFLANIKDMAILACWSNEARLDIWITSITKIQTNKKPRLFYFFIWLSKKTFGLYREAYLGQNSKGLWNLAVDILVHIYPLLLCF